MGDVFGVVGGVDDHFEGVISYFVDDDVVDDSPGGVRKHGVLTVIVSEGSNVVSGDVFKEIENSFAFECQAGHMGDIEHPGSVSDSEGLGDNGFVLDWEFKSGEFNHTASEVDVVLVERGYGRI